MNKHNQNSCFLPIPKSFRKNLREENHPLPIWLTKTLNMNCNGSSTFGTLLSYHPPEEFLNTLDENTLSAINDLCVNSLNLNDLKSSDIKLGQDLNILDKPLSELPFEARALTNALARKNIHSCVKLSNLSYRDFFKIENCGIKYLYTAVLILERFCTKDFMPVSEKPELQLTRISYDELISSLFLISNRLMNRDYIDLVNLTDSRFQSVRNIFNNFKVESDYLVDILELVTENVPTETNLLTQLVSSLEFLENSLNSIDNLSLEKQIFIPLSLHVKLNEDKKIAFSKRLGLSGEDPLTLEATSSLWPQRKITRERVRQIESEFLRKISGKNIYIPKLIQALNYLEEIKSPLSDEKCQNILEKKGYGRFSIKALRQICDTFDKEFRFNLKKINGCLFLITDKGSDIDKIMRKAKSLCCTTGFINLNDLSDYLHCVEKIDISIDKIEQFLLTGHFKKLAKDWYVSTDITNYTDRFRNTTLKMLYCVSPLSVKDIREGLKRVFFVRKHLQKGWPWLLAPSKVMINYFKDSSEFSIDEYNYVKVSNDIMENYKPADTIRNIKEIIESQPHNIIDNKAFYNAAIKIGIAPASFQLYCSYEPYIERFDEGVWGLRGSNPSPEDISLLRDYVKYLPRRKRKIHSGFNENGEIEIITRIDRVVKHVLSVNIQIGFYIADDIFTIKGISGIEYGDLKAAPSNKCAFTGSPKALTRMGIEDGDLVRYTFNLTTNEVLLEQVPESLIWEL